MCSTATSANSLYTDTSISSMLSKSMIVLFNSYKVFPLQIRSSIVEYLADTDHVTLDALQQTAHCFKVITKQTDELTGKAQVTSETSACVLQVMRTHVN